MHEGHRKRMLERSTDAENMQDHELLEILLFNPIPRKNTNEIAHELLAAFGSLKNVFAAGTGELASVGGVGEATARYLKCVGEVFLRMSRTKSAEEADLPDAFNFHDFQAVVTERFGGLEEEYVDLFSLDACGHINYVARYTTHEGNKAFVPFEELAHFFLSNRPAGLVVAHNHPSMSEEPSKQDDAFTVQLQLLCSMNGVKFRDHIIVGHGGAYSYFMHGRLEAMERTFDIERLLKGKDIT